MLGVFNMRIHIVRGFLVCVLALCAPRAWAFLDPPFITPANPSAGDVIAVNVYGGECDVLNTGIVPPAITQQGSETTILFTGIHEEDPEWCYFSLATESFSLGKYAAGAHTLRVERRYMSVLGPWVQETLGIIPFTVTGVPSAQPIETPTLSIIGLGGLLLALSTTALISLRLRRV